MRISSVIIFAALIGFAHARIGETFEQCTERYGEARTTTADKSKAEFKVGAVSIMCWFNGGICDSVSYAIFLPIGVNQKEQGFNFDHSVKLLNFNSHNIQWHQTEKCSFGSKWNGVYYTVDKSLRADVSERGIHIDTVVSRDREIGLAQANTLDKSLASFGADESTASPIAKSGHLPPTKDELEQQERTKAIEDLQRKLSQ